MIEKKQIHAKCKHAKQKRDIVMVLLYANMLSRKVIVKIVVVLLYINRNHKTKEKDVADRILKIFSNFTWVWDKTVQDGCSKRRPDLLVDMGSHIIIVEIDDNAHTTYDCICGNKRLIQISQDLAHRPIVLIRFNPDSYISIEGNKVKSCWKLNRKTGLIVLDPNKIKEWEERIKSLVEQIAYWEKNPSEKTIEIVELFY